MSAVETIVWIFAAAWLLVLVGTWRSLRVFGFPADPDEDRAPGSWPRVSIIVPCRDEVERVREAIASLANTEYPAREIIVVDDRSTDGTDEVLEELSRKYVELQVVKVGRLPSGWLGKCHALALGAREATGEWLLFTDADVSHHPRLLSQAVDHAERRGLSLLSLLPRNVTRSWWVGAVVPFIYTLTLVSLGFWIRRAKRQSLIAAGAGAFSLVRRDAYDAIGGHRSLRLDVIDDVALAQSVARNGGSTELRFAGTALELPYFRTIGELLQVSRKNAWAAFGFDWWKLVGATVALLGLVTFAPIFALTSSGTWLPALVLWGAFAATLRLAASRTQGHGAGILIAPLLAPLVLLPVWMSAIAGATTGKIVWRDRDYSISELAAWLRSRPQRWNQRQDAPDRAEGLDEPDLPPRERPPASTAGRG